MLRQQQGAAAPALPGQHFSMAQQLQGLPGCPPQQLQEQLLLQLMPQELVWTPHRLSEFLASSGAPPPASAALQHLPSVVQLLPLVSSVVASKARAEQQGAGSNSSSDTCGHPRAAGLPEQGTSQPSSSSGQLTVCWLGSTQRQPGAVDEMTSPHAHPQPQQGQHTTLTGGHSSNKQSHNTQQQQQHWWLPQQGVAPQAVPTVHLQHLPGVMWQAACQQQVRQGQGEQLWQQPQQQQQQLFSDSTAMPWVQGQLPHAAAVATAQAAAGMASSGFPLKQASEGDYSVVEQNPAWSASALTSAAAAAAVSLGLPPASCPADGCSGHGDDSSTVQVSDAARSQEQARAAQAPVFGVLMLVHEKGVTCSEAWDAWEGAHSGKVVVRVHLKGGVSTAGLPGDAWVSSRQLPSRICSKWGCISLTAAILQAAADMLQQHPQLQHVALVSGQDVPVSAVPRDLRPGLSLFGRFQFGRVFDDAARQVACEVLQQQLGMSRAQGRAWGDALVFHHTWMALDRQLLLALISKQEELLRVGSVLNERFMQPDVAVAADEFILMTAAMRYGFVRQVVQRKLHAHMSAVRRQQRQQQQQVTVTAAAGAASQPHASAGEAAAAAAADGNDARPAKQPRLRLKPEPPGSLRQDAPAAAAGAAGLGRQRVEGSGSRPGSRDSSRASNPKPEPQSVPAEASRRSSGDSSSEQAPSSRRSQRREQASGDAAIIPPELLVGRRIKVWWEMDQAFYSGLVTYYSLSTRRHTVKYDDGDVEIINLANEAWKLEGQPPAAAAAAGAPAGRASSGPACRTGGGGGSNTPSAPAPGISGDCALQEGTFGVLLDCCPTLALFHPTQTRHPHEWRNFSECLACDVVSSRSGGANRLTLLDALRLVAPNSALFFRKVSEMQRQVPAQLLGCLKLLWKSRPLPALIEELALQE